MSVQRNTRAHRGVLAKVGRLPAAAQDGLLCRIRGTYSGLYPGIHY